MTYEIKYMRYMGRITREMVLCLAKQGDVVYIDSEDYNTNDFDLKREGLQFAITKLLSWDYFKLFNHVLEGIKNTQWNYTIGMDVVGGWRRIIS